MGSHARLFAAFVFVATSVLAVPQAATAQSASEQATRRLLLGQAQEARVAGNHRRALELAEHAAAVQMTPSLRLFIAEEQLAVGAFAEAMGSAEVCSREVDRDAALPNRVAILAACRAVATQSRQRVAQLTIRVREPIPPSLRVRVNGAPVSAALLGVPNAVSPGTIVIEASADDRAPTRREVQLVSGASAEIELVLPSAPASSAPVTTAVSIASRAPEPATPAINVGPASPAPASAAPPRTAALAPRVASDSPAPTARDATAPAPTPDRTAPSRAAVAFPPSAAPSPTAHGVSVAAIGLVAVGIVGLAIGAGFTVARADAIGNCHFDSTDPRLIHCPTLADAQRASSEMRDLGVSVASFAIGGVALVAGALWAIVGGHRSNDRPPHATLGFAVFGDGGQLQFTGSFQ